MNAVTTTDNREKTPAAVFRDQIDRMEDQIRAALPLHVSLDRFKRVVVTAVLSNVDLLKADRQSLLEASIRAATDGLIPDGREGALVVFNTNERFKGDDGKWRDNWIKKVQWMPMVLGIQKKLRNSGELSFITSHVVYAGDHYRFWVDDQGEHVEYEPSEKADTDTVRWVFAMAVLKDGRCYAEPLRPSEVEKIRSVSRSADKGPWAQWWSEMARKSAIRRLSKRLPLSAELHDFIRQDDALYDLAREPQRPQPSGLAARLSGARGPGFNHAQIERTVAGDETPALEHHETTESSLGASGPGDEAGEDPGDTTSPAAQDAPPRSTFRERGAEGEATRPASPSPSPASQAGDAADRSGEGDLPSPEDIAAHRQESPAYDLGWTHAFKQKRKEPAARDPEWGNDDEHDYLLGFRHGKAARERDAAKEG